MSGPNYGSMGKQTSLVIRAVFMVEPIIRELSIWEGGGLKPVAGIITKDSIV